MWPRLFILVLICGFIFPSSAADISDRHFCKQNGDTWCRSIHALGKTSSYGDDWPRERFFVIVRNKDDFFDLEKKLFKEDFNHDPNVHLQRGGAFEEYNDFVDPLRNFDDVFKDWVILAVVGNRKGDFRKRITVTEPRWDGNEVVFHYDFDSGAKGFQSLRDPAADESIATRPFDIFAVEKDEFSRAGRQFLETTPVKFIVVQKGGVTTPSEADSRLPDEPPRP